MKRTQIQLPDPLYDEVKRLARNLDWSIAEVIRRGVEEVVRCYPAIKDEPGGWSLPSPVDARLKVTDPGRLRDLAWNDEEGRALA